MTAYNRFKSLITTTTGFHFYRDNPPWGVSLEKDLPRLIPDFRPRTIFDVGANIGQTADRFRQIYPTAVIHCFEPVPATFEVLRQRQRDHPNVQCHRLALSDRCGTGRINVYGSSEICSLEPGRGNATSSESVDIQTIDAFATEHRIPVIDLLKIDAEGHDLAVLRGAEAMLKAAQTTFVFVEVQLSRYYSINNTGTKPLSIGQVTDLLEPLGYRCLGLYDQSFVPTWGLHYANALFGPIKTFP